MFKDFQVKMISKDDSGACKFIKRDFGTAVFLWILRTLRTPFYIEHFRWVLLIIVLTTESIKQQINTRFSCKIFVFYRKWKIRNVVVLDVLYAAHLEAFLIKQGVLFLQVSSVLGVCRGMRVWSHASYAKAC